MCFENDVRKYLPSLASLQTRNPATPETKIAYGKNTGWNFLAGFQQVIAIDTILSFVGICVLSFVTISVFVFLSQLKFFFSFVII